MDSATTDLDRYVTSKIASGEFESREEFFREAARVYRELETRSVDLKSLVQERIRESDQDGNCPLDIDAIKTELAAELNEFGQAK